VTGRIGRNSWSRFRMRTYAWWRTGQDLRRQRDNCIGPAGLWAFRPIQSTRLLPGGPPPAWGVMIKAEGPDHRPGRQDGSRDHFGSFDAAGPMPRQ
jgi:hypothetical protein